MPSRANRGVSPQLVVWLLLVILLVLVLLNSSQKVEPHAEELAYSVAARRILDRANAYREYWLVNHQPSQAEIEGKRVTFSPQGWAVPALKGDMACREWFQLLYPKQSVYGQRYQKAEWADLSFGYQCRYLFGKDKNIELSLKGKQFSVFVGFRFQPAE